MMSAAGIPHSLWSSRSVCRTRLRGASPARHVRARLGISPLTALGAAAAVLMLALVVFSYIRLYEARSDVGKLQTQLSTLEEQQARLQSQYDNALDLEQIEKRAKELGMRPAGQLCRSSMCRSMRTIRRRSMPRLRRRMCSSA